MWRTSGLECVRYGDGYLWPESGAERVSCGGGGSVGNNGHIMKRSGVKSLGCERIELGWG